VAVAAHARTPNTASHAYRPDRRERIALELALSLASVKLSMHYASGKA
jgi:hypothetical protein